MYIFPAESANTPPFEPVPVPNRYEYPMRLPDELYFKINVLDTPDEIGRE
jgi:hypothetical protein